MKNVNAMRNFGDLMDTIFEGRLTPNFREESYNHRMQPPVNIYEMDNNFYIEVMAPGVPKDEVKLQVLDNMLTIVYDKSEPAKDANGKTLRSEFAVRSFKRSFTLGQTVDAEKINASFDSGILKITLPKKEVIKPTQIEITVN